MKTLFVGIVDAARTPHGYPKTPGLLEVHARENLDTLPPYILEYCGEREITKEQLTENLTRDEKGFLCHMNLKYPERNFTKLAIVFD